MHAEVPHDRLLVPHDRLLFPSDRLLTKIAATSVDLRVVVGVKEFLLGPLQIDRVDGQLSE